MVLKPSYKGARKKFILPLKTEGWEGQSLGDMSSIWRALEA